MSDGVCTADLFLQVALLNCLLFYTSLRVSIALTRMPLKTARTLVAWQCGVCDEARCADKRICLHHSSVPTSINIHHQKGRDHVMKCRFQADQPSHVSRIFRNLRNASRARNRVCEGHSSAHSKEVKFITPCRSASDDGAK